MVCCSRTTRSVSVPNGLTCSVIAEMHNTGLPPFQVLGTTDLGNFLLPFSGLWQWMAATEALVLLLTFERRRRAHPIHQSAPDLDSPSPCGL